MDFLSYRLLVNNNFSPAPQLVLCISILCLLFILCTVDSRYRYPVKLSSDKIHRRDKPLTPAVSVPYINTAQLSEFVKCWNNACQEFNVNKTNEILMTFSQRINYSCHCCNSYVQNKLQTHLSPEGQLLQGP